MDNTAKFIELHGLPERVTQSSFFLLKSELERHGNELSKAHKDALLGLCYAMTTLATGEHKGRVVYPLAAGLGKTTAIKCWIKTVSDHEDHCELSAAVSAFKVEQLCELKRELIEMGVPAEKIGLVHSKKDASEPSEGHGRQFVLVTHSRIKLNDSMPWYEYNGQPRSILFHDESLIKSEPKHSSLRGPGGLLGTLALYLNNYPHLETYKPAIAYLESVHTALSKTREDCEKQDDVVTQLPPIDSELEQSLKQLPEFEEKLSELLGLAQEPIRLTKTQQDYSLIGYEIAIPASLNNVLILDASYPVREMCLLDDELQTPETIPEFHRYCKSPIANVKRYDNVIVNQMYAGGGRSTINKHIEQAAEENQLADIVKEVVDVVTSIPEHESILIFTHKRKYDTEVDITDTLKDALVTSGIDPADISTPEDSGQVRRINFLTWGMETATNDYAHCKNVILFGVLHKPQGTMAAMRLGQQDNIMDAELSAEVAKDLVKSEVAHCIYQALNRGSMRKVTEASEHTQAMPMKAWLIERTDIVNRLREVLPGVRWENWVLGHLETGKIRRIADEIALYLDVYEHRWNTKTVISINQIKKDLKHTGVPKSTWRKALDSLLVEPDNHWNVPAGSRSVVLYGKIAVSCREYYDTLGYEPDNLEHHFEYYKDQYEDTEKENEDYRRQLAIDAVKRAYPDKYPEPKKPDRLTSEEIRKLIRYPEKDSTDEDKKV